MSESNRHGEVIYDADGRPSVTACRPPFAGRRPRCAYCEAESTRACDAPAARPREGRWGRCWRPMCEAHTARIGERHDLCGEHAVDDLAAVLRVGDRAHNVFWEVVETNAAPIAGIERPREPRDRIPGVLDPDDERRDG